MSRLKMGAALQNGRFVLEKVLGQGSFGVTYKASMQTSVQGDLGSLKTNINVAVKEFFMNGMNTRGSDGSWVEGSDGEIVQNYRRKFRKEAENLSRLDHPNIVKVLSIFDENNTTYYVMEYLEGESLDQCIVRNGRLEETEAISVIRQVGSALQYMHQHNMLHLDLKPGNVMCTNDGRTVLIDFGLSKQYDDKGEPESSTTLGLGTKGYAPVEQADYRQDGTFPATLDVYALGATFFKMLTGIRPLSASELLNDDSFLERNLSDTGVSPQTIAVVCKAMAYRRKDRFQTVEEFLQALPSQELLYDEKTELSSLETEETELSRPLPTHHSGPEPESPIMEMNVNPVPSLELPQVTANKPKGKLRKGIVIGIVTVCLAVVLTVVLILSFKGGGSKDEMSDEEVSQKPTQDPYTVAIPATFDEASDFSEGLARVKINDKWGFIDKTGQFVISATFEYASKFSEGLACVEINNKKGFMDKTGNIVIPAQFSYADDFKDGMATVAIDGRYGFVDKTGDIIIPIKYSLAECFSEGLAPVLIKGKWGFINKKGELVIPAKFDAAYHFSEGLALVRNAYKYGYIDKSGNVVIPVTLDLANDFTEGYTSVNIKGKSCIIDKTGNVVFSDTIFYAGGFIGGVARVKINEKYGYIDKTGKVVIPAIFDFAWDFSEDLACVRINGKYGFVDKMGKMAIPAIFDIAEDFSEGFSRVKIDGKWGYVKYNK